MTTTTFLTTIKTLMYWENCFIQRWSICDDKLFWTPNIFFGREKNSSWNVQDLPNSTVPSGFLLSVSEWRNQRNQATERMRFFYSPAIYTMFEEADVLSMYVSPCSALVSWFIQHELSFDTHHPGEHHYHHSQPMRKKARTSESLPEEVCSSSLLAWYLIGAECHMAQIQGLCNLNLHHLE